MTFQCLECGRIFDDSEFAEWVEPHGERMSGCPGCKSPDYEAVIECELCGESHIASEMIGEVCKDCFDSYRYDHETCFKIGKHGKTTISINSFIAEMFDENEIAEIVFKHLKETNVGKKIDCELFLYGDKNFFAEYLVEEVNK